LEFDNKKVIILIKCKMAKWKIIIITFLVLMFLINISLGCKDTYTIDEYVIISDLIEPGGEGATCNITIYNELVFNQSGLMTRNGVAYEYNASRLSKGIYSAFINCNITSVENVVTLYEGECKFEVIYGDKMIIAVIILLPMLLGIIFLIGAVTLDNEQHKAMKIFLYLLSMVPFFTSMHFGLLAIVKFYNFPELQELIGSTTYWVAIIFGLLITYFIIYLFTKMIHQAAQKKNERMKY